MWEMHAIENGRSGRSGGRHSSASEQNPGNGSAQGPPPFPCTSEDLHAWSIYRQNLNSDFTDSALGSSEKSPMPYGNFHLRETTMQSILNNPKYGPKSELGANMYTYLKFGLPRVLPPNAKNGSGHDNGELGHPGSSGYDSTDEELVLRNGARSAPGFHGGLRSARSEDFLGASSRSRRSARAQHEGHGNQQLRKHASRDDHLWQSNGRERKLKAVSEANLLDSGIHGGYMDHEQPRMYRSSKVFRSNGHLQQTQSHDVLQSGAFVNRGLDRDEDEDDEEDDDEEEEEEEEVHHIGRSSRMGGKAASQLSVVSRQSRNMHLNGGVSYRHEAPMLNDKYFPRDYLGTSNYLGNGASNGLANGGSASNGGPEYDGFKYPHLQLRNVCFDTKRGKNSERILDSITMEARGGELVAILATKRK